MNIQQARTDLALIFADMMASGWKATTETTPDINSATIQVGHAVLVEPRSYSKYTAEITVTLWINEADSKLGVTQLYALISPGEDSIWNRLHAAVTVPGTARTLSFGEITAGNVGRRDEGPTGFLAADLTVRIAV